jgi:hypothetical protein
MFKSFGPSNKAKQIKKRTTIQNADPRLLKHQIKPRPKKWPKLNKTISCKNIKPLAKANA